MVACAIDLTIEDGNGKEIGVEKRFLGMLEPLTIIARESQFQFLSAGNNVSFTRAEIKRIEAWIE